ncbi:TPA: hypothetical protein VK265_000247 [Streptococcus pyogenes]|uniref:hypothetical protein n=1 Tax=Streptococcus pyogenes TaxID=1314 RepID=UPI001559FDA1|nr:hypothetical protein [Streptococcus pyogenes]HER5557555.1 hypothetical protein [Streptococcus pyogenes]HER5559315.1 hypothetical protein [Streptococcus pyogenes]
MILFLGGAYGSDFLWNSMPVLTPLLPQQKAAVLAHVTRRNKKLVVKSAEQFMLFEHQTGFVSSLRLKKEYFLQSF